jgi:branched-chain amino acid transport system substrate-binding protein
MKKSIIAQRSTQTKSANWLYLTGLLLIVALVISACGGAAPAPAEQPAEEAAPTEESAPAEEEAMEEAPATEEAIEEEAPATEEAMEEPASGEPVLFFAPAELSGAGATVGTNWKNGVELAMEDINAEGGILGRPVEVVFEDTQSDPATSKAVIAKGLEENPYAIVGPLYSGSIIVNMVEAERAGIPQIVGGEAANLTEQGNEYIFRTSFGQSTSMPKLANYMEESGIGSVDIVWINNDFGKGGRDAITTELDARGISVVNDISAEEQQADFAPEALTVLGSEADALFVYMNEEESARLLSELQKQGFEKPIIGETTLIAQSTIDLAGDAANGVKGHVGLTASAPIPAIEEYAKRFEEKYGAAPDHNGLKGYIAMYVLKEATERLGEFDSQKLADALHCTTITTEDEPGVLMDIVFDEKGDVDRESFLVEVQNGQQVVTEVLPRVGGSCGEAGGAATEEEAPVEEEAMAEPASGEPILFFAPAELSGAGSTVGNNWKDGATIAIEEINAAGGILGRPIEVEWEDTQSDPATSKAVIAKGLEENPYVVLGPLYSGSIIVNMVEAERAGVTQIMGGEAANLTEQDNPYIFRTSFGQATSMPKLATYMETSGITSVDIVWINNDFGKGGRDAITTELDARDITIVNDISAEEQQADFAPEALTVLGSEADALFVYMTEEESARLLVELRKQGFEKPIIGETVLIAQSVIDLAGEAAEGAQGHVGLTASAPLPLVQEYTQKFEERYGHTPDHNNMKGYIAVYIVKEATERVGEFDSQKLAESLHCTTITTEDEPGVLMDIVYDENGDVDRESFLVEVQDGKQVVTEVLPRLGNSCGEK